MSQPNVERVLGLLVTDEAFRRRFAGDPDAALQQLVEQGLQLSWCERTALAATDLDQLARFAAALDPRIQKSDLTGGGPS
jgi:putative modified peptide